ncbi:hypothetical protein ABU162_16715 [Paenibacillus thiaminolyticus]|uniref:hypothetical protein n=1 Tax=Paenibacillus thiaminolyticus TaxID=49283 RepID=UPI0035A6AE66
MAVGAFDGDTLAGFGVLAYQLRGDHRDYERVAEEARKGSEVPLYFVNGHTLGRIFL